MRRRLSQSALLAAALVLCAAGRAADQRAALREAVADLQHGDFCAAEQKLRVEVAAHPDDAPALSLLGVALDSQNLFVKRRSSIAGPWRSRRAPATF